MKSAPQDLADAIDGRIGRQKLVWFGTRGSDARALLRLRAFSELFSLIAPLGSIALEKERCLETEKHLRVDLDNYRIDDDASPEAVELHHQMYVSLAQGAFLASYRPSNFLASIYFPRILNVRYLGLFHEAQGIFEHKPWVETELKRIGVNTIPWSYLSDSDLAVLVERLRDGPQVVRSTRSDGGAGIILMDDPDEIRARLVPHIDHLISIAPYYVDNVPLNVNAVVFPTGTVSLHPLSVQLIGIPSCTRRRFGYCGNDFAQSKELPQAAVDEMEDFVIRIGRWLHSKGYLGAFGVDALLVEGRILITEINPRFQGSSDLSSWIDLEAERPDMFLEHIAAFLGLEPRVDKTRLRDLVRVQSKMSQIICHNVSPVYKKRLADTPPNPSILGELELLPHSTVNVAPEAILFRAHVAGPVTESGTGLLPPYAAAISATSEGFFEAAPNSDERGGEQ